VSATADAVDELASVLFGLRGGGMSTKAFTAAITRAIVEWALGRGWSVKTEARVTAPPARAPDPRLGFIDVVVRRGGGHADLAIEIDSADKPWSVDKLRHAVAGGMRGVWVRWGDEKWAGVYDDVDVIQLPALRRPAVRVEQTNQLELWR